jgi:hypothetical protein
MGEKDMLCLKDDDVLIRTHFINKCPETYIEKEYAPYFGGNHVDETNRCVLDAPTTIKERLRDNYCQTPVYSGC